MPVLCTRIVVTGTFVKVKFISAAVNIWLCMLAQLQERAVCMSRREKLVLDMCVLLQKCVYYCNRKDGMYIEVEAKVGCTLNRRCTLLGPCMVKEDFWGCLLWVGLEVCN